VSESQIRTVIRAYKQRLFTDLFPGRTQVPKTIIFAKDDAHAEEIVRIVREEFGKGNDFCKKITYRVTGVDPETLIAQFRNSYDPRIAVTVDMISTGTDIKPVEVLLFMRAVQSRVLYEQMIGRGTRVISATDLQAVTSDATAKTHFVIVDAVGITEDPKVETTTLERKPSAPLAKLLEAVAQGIRDDDTLSTLAGRLTRLARRATPQDVYTVAALAAGASLNDLANRLLDAIDPDQPLTGDADVGAHRIDEACAPFDDPQLRKALVEMQVRNEQTIDAISIDRVTEARFVPSDQARTTVASFRAYLEQHRDEITALQLIYSRPYAQRALTYRQVKELAEQLRLADQSWTTESLWLAYAQVEQDRVRGVGAQRVLADLVSLVRHAVQLDDELVPYPERVARRYAEWMADQEAQGRIFTPEQRWWLDQIARHIGVNLAISPDDLSAPPFFDRGGLFGAARVLGPDVKRVLEEMNEALAV
jgi:type I restriction enzyme R subunit